MRNLKLIGCAVMFIVNFAGSEDVSAQICQRHVRGFFQRPAIGVWHSSAYSTWSTQDCMACGSDQFAPPSGMIPQVYEETFSVQVPITETRIGPDGTPQTVTRYQTQSQTRQVTRYESPADVIQRLQSEIGNLSGKQNAQDLRLGTNEQTDVNQQQEIETLENKVNK